MTTPVTNESIHGRVAAYYADKLGRFGATPRGVDWRDVDSQQLRFRQLLAICDGERSASLIELGCGYGALLDFWRDADFDGDYVGYDVSPEMVAAARRAHEGDTKARFSASAEPEAKADYCVASGVFNVRLDFDDEEWRAYVFETIDIMAAAANAGFAFNCLTSFSDCDRMEARLFYADPGEMLDHCLARYGRHVALRHDYGLYEFTVLVRTGAAA